MDTINEQCEYKAICKHEGDCPEVDCWRREFYEGNFQGWFKHFMATCNGELDNIKRRYD
jgi:hypothetical protein